MNKKNMRININKNKGFTIVELMIAMAIVSLVMAAIVSAFISQQESYDTQEQVAVMQQNGRAAMSALSLDVRIAGFGLGNASTSYYDTSAGATVYLQAVASHNNYTNGTDRIDICYSDPSGTTEITDDMPNSSAILKVDTVNGFAAGDLLIITNGTNASILEVTAVNASALTIQHNPGGDTINPPGGHNIFPAGGYPAGSKLFKVKLKSYDIDFTDPFHPQMRMDPDGPLGSDAFQPFADNIEDLQFAYIFSDGDEANSADETDGDDTNDHSDIR
ncbi:MAG: prepilin-type N-terminal cleavage/methylation domain-containing protein, partial [Deltaproteobacteria bacterium]|nr:prepilin-type N-terminal cleavage/methylation domain-containing protein [Deltaproteobacteria bacterium]